jgi:flagellar basal-body rod protein FlgB
MESKGIFGETFGLIEKAMDLRSRKHNIIVSNISNADTPNYKAFDMIVEEEIQKSIDRSHDISLNTTNTNHIGYTGKRPIQQNIKYYESSNSTIRGDNNNVELDKEMAKLMENNLLYNSLANIISKKFRGLKAVIQSNRG